MHPLFERLTTIFSPALLEHIVLVGGSVRDYLLGKESQDIDLAGVVLPEELVALGFRHVAAKSTAPIWFLYHHDLGKIEFTLLNDQEELVTDLRRRDFAANALALTCHGDIIDPCNGRRDLATRTLTACSPETFAIDPIRIFRAFRFEAEGWRLDHATETMITHQDWEERFSSIAAERFSREMLKALVADDPARFFRRMIDLDTGRFFLPELFRMADVPAGPIACHPEGDLLSHSLEVLERISSLTPEPLPRFCAMFHDLGKLATAPEEYPRHIGHEKAGALMAKPFADRLRLPAQYRRALAGTSLTHMTTGRWHELRSSTKLTLAEQAVKSGIADFLPLLVMADGGHQREMPGWDTVLEVLALPTSELQIRPGLISGPDALPPAERAALIHQHRVQLLKEKSRDS